MRDVFIIMTVLATIPMIFMRPHVGILAWCWISYMNPHRLSWDFAYTFPVAMLIGGATLVALAISPESKKLQINPISGLLLAFAFWFSFANLFAEMPSLAWTKWEQSIKIVLMTFVTMILMQKRERLYALVWVIVLSLGFFGVKGGAFTVMTAGVSHVWGPPGTFIADNNALAMALVMAIPLIRYLQLQTQSQLIRLGLYGAMILIAFSIIGSQSRGAFLGGSAMIAFLIWKSRQRLLLSAMVVAFVAVGAAFVPQSWTDRMHTIETYDEDASALNRLEVWGFAIKVANDRPFVGGGFRVFANEDLYRKYVPDARTGRGRNYHSVYFEILGELGYVGLLIYVALIFAVWRSGSRTIARTRHRPEMQWAHDLARMVQVSLVGFVVAGAFQNLAFFDLYFHLAAILFILDRIVVAELALDKPSPAPEGRRAPFSSARPATSKGMARS